MSVAVHTPQAVDSLVLNICRPSSVKMPAQISGTTAPTAEQHPQPRAAPSVDEGEEIKPQVAQALRNQLDKCLSTARSIKSRRLFKKLDELIVKYFPPIPDLSSAELFVIQERVLKKFCEYCNLTVAITTSKVDILRYDPVSLRCSSSRT